MAGVMARCFLMLFPHAHSLKSRGATQDLVGEVGFVVRLIQDQEDCWIGGVQANIKAEIGIGTPTCE